MLIKTAVDDTLKKVLQEYLKLTINGKIIKQGKFIIYSFDHYHITLLFFRNNKEEKIEIPFPFLIYTKKGNIIFDYQIESLSEGDDELHGLLVNANQTKESRFYNKQLKIEQV